MSPLLPLVAISIAAASPVALRPAAKALPSEAISQFNPDLLELVGWSAAEVCNNDIGVMNYSCVTKDLKAIGFMPESFSYAYPSSRVVSLSDDTVSQQSYIYIYRTDINRNYTHASISFDASDFEEMSIPSAEEIQPSFTNYQLEPVSMTEDLHVVKYKIYGIPTEFYSQSERNYVIRELIDMNDRANSEAYLLSAMNYVAGDDGSGELKVAQNALNYYTAEQLLVESYIHIADSTNLPLRYDSRIMGQSILLFNIFKQGELFLNKLRAIEVQVDFYQWYGALNLEVRNNAERGEQVVKQMIAANWKSGEKGTLPEAFTKVSETKNTSMIIQSKSHEIDYKPSFWHWWKTRSYSWNDLDFTKNFDKSNKHVDGTFLDNFTYYAVLKTFDFEISPTGYKASNGKSHWQVTNRSDGYLPYTFEKVSLAKFWYEEGEKVKTGIVLSRFDDSYGTVKLVDSNHNGFSFPTWAWITIGVIILITLGFLLKALGTLEKTLEFLFKLVFWPFFLIRYIVKKRHANQRKK